MMENSTAEVSIVNNGYNLIWVYFIWICFFFTTALPNLIVSLCIVRYRALNQRKEYLIMAGLSFGDFIMVSGYSIAGFHRLVLVLSDQWISKRSTWICVTLVHNVFLWFSVPICGIMLVVVSFDRFLSVSSPLKYFSMTKTYAHRILSMVYGFAVFVCLLIIGLAFSQKHESAQLVAPCFTGATVLAVNKYYAAYYMYVHSVTGLISVVLYVGVGVMYWKKKQQLVASTINSHSQIARDRKRQRKLTKNLAVSCLCTCILLVIPSGVGFSGEIVNELPRWVLQFLFSLPPVNPFCNVIIYYKRQPHLRKAIRALFTNKMMPANLDLWNVD